MIGAGGSRNLAHVDDFRDLMRKISDVVRNTVWNIDEIEDAPSCAQNHLLSTSQVFEITITLTRLNLPKDIIPDILDLAEIYACRRVGHSAEHKSVTWRNTKPVHSVAFLPTDIHPKSLKAILFETVSKAAQRSEFPADSIFNESKTWFDAGVLEQTYLPEHTAALVAAAASTAGINSDGVEKKKEKNQQQQQIQQKRQKAKANGDNVKKPDYLFYRIIDNNPTKTVFARQQVRVLCSDTHPWVRYMFSRLKAGEPIAIRTCSGELSGYGHLNNVASTSIFVQYRAVRKVP